MSTSNTSASEQNDQESEHSSKKEQTSTQYQHTPVVHSAELKALNSYVAMRAVVEMEHRFKEGTIAYADGIQAYNLEIEKVKSRIHREKEAKESEESRLLEIKAEIKHKERLLQKLNETFSQEIKSLEELQDEYRDMIDASDFKRLHKQKKRDIKKILDETEEMEIDLLKEELERLNLSEKLEPKKESIRELKAILRELEMKKMHYESSKLHQIPQLGINNAKKALLSDNETVETEIIQESTSE